MHVSRYAFVFRSYLKRVFARSVSELSECRGMVLLRTQASVLLLRLGPARCMRGTQAVVNIRVLFRFCQDDKQCGVVLQGVSYGAVCCRWSRTVFSCVYKHSELRAHTRRPQDLRIYFAY